MIIIIQLATISTAAIEFPIDDAAYVQFPYFSISDMWEEDCAEMIILLKR